MNEGQHELSGAEIGRTELGAGLFAAAVRTTRMPMVLTDPNLPDNPIVFVNDAFCLLTGYAREEVLDRNCRFLQGPDTDPTLIAKVREAISQRRAIDIELLNYKKSGETFWNRLLVSPVFDSNGDLTYFFASQYDDSISRSTQDVLREAQQRLDTLIRTSSEIRYSVNADWSVLSQLAGGAVIPDTMSADADWLNTYIPPREQPTVRAEITRAMSTRSPYSLEHRVKRVDGSTGWARSCAVPLFDAGGDITGWLGAASDVTARRTTQAALQESESRLRAIVDTVPVGIVMADADGRIFYGNAQAEAILGHPVIHSPNAEAYGDWGALTVDGRRLEAREYPLARVLAGEERPDLELRYQRGDGRQTWVRLVGAPLRDANGERSGAVVAFLDIGREKDAEAATRESEAYWRGLFEHMNEGFMVAEVVRDADGIARSWRFSDMNPAWARISGLSIARSRGQRVDEVIPDVEREWIERYVRIAETGEPDAFKSPVLALDQIYDVRAFRVAPDRVGVLFQEVSAQHRADILRDALLDLTDRLRDETDPAEMAFAAAEIMGRALGTDRVGYARIHAGTMVIERDWTAPGFLSGMGVHEIKTFGTPVADLANGRAFIVTDIVKDTRLTSDEIASFAAFSVVALIHLPVFENGRATAFFYVNSSRPRQWLAEEIAFVRTVTEQTHVTTGRRRAELELRTVNTSLEHLVAERTRERNPALDRQPGCFRGHGAGRYDRFRQSRLDPCARLDRARGHRPHDGLAGALRRSRQDPR